MKLSRGRFSHLSSHLWYMIETASNPASEPVLPAMRHSRSLYVSPWSWPLAVTGLLTECHHAHPKSPSEVTWPPPPPQWLPRSPWPPGPQASAVIQASGDARGPVQGTVGEGCWPPGCHRQRCGCGVTGAAAAVIADSGRWTDGERGGGGRGALGRRVSKRGELVRKGGGGALLPKLEGCPFQP